MKYVSLSTTDNYILPFYLAEEEYIARFMDEGEYFFLWQVEPTVIFGRNQIIENEVNIDFCKRHKIQIYRRKSGGGCVYADMNNVMFSYINTGFDVTKTFDHYLQLVVSMLKKLGINATYSEHNDIMIGDRKVSGNAFYHIPGRNIVHGTMLYDTNMENMVGSITPDNEKLRRHGVESVRQRITFLKDYISLSLDEFKTFAKNNICDEETVLTDDDLIKIKEIEQEYLNFEFIYGKQKNMPI